MVRSEPVTASLVEARVCPSGCPPCRPGRTDVAAFVVDFGPEIPSIEVRPTAILAPSVVAALHRFPPAGVPWSQAVECATQGGHRPARRLRLCQASRSGESDANRATTQNMPAHHSHW
jgi:hypothetical protein